MSGKAGEDKLPTKCDRRFRVFRRRLKSSVVRDPNGSRSAFIRFYQSGGRDYEQYRRWLLTQQHLNSSSTQIDSTRVKYEPIEREPITQTYSFSTTNEMPLPTVVYPSLPSIQSLNPPNPQRCLVTLSNWTVNDVAEFVDKNFAEKNIVQKFIQQKIDGRTLPLLTEDHLTRVFKMKLGPALRLLDLIHNLRTQHVSPEIY